MNPFRKVFARAPLPPTDADTLGADELADFAATRAEAPHGAAEADDGDGVWQQSSFDLRQGADIVDFSDTIPAELFDRLFNKG